MLGSAMGVAGGFDGHDACGTGFLADREGRPRRELLPLALRALARMAHRGALSSDGETGDGAGVLTQIPWAVLGQARPEALGLGALFLPRGADDAAAARQLVEEALASLGLRLVGWRELPVREEALGRIARESRPELAQVFVERPSRPGDFEALLFAARREIEARAAERGLLDLYVASLSHRSVVYKALLSAGELAEFYRDLTHPDFATSFAVFHNRFSTNTLPSWAMTQPFRQLAHNGEINTIDGNRSWMGARGRSLVPARLGLSQRGCEPLLPPGVSDSASLDEALRLLQAARWSLLEAVTLLMPPAWENDPELPQAVRALYDSGSRRMEPWDGPALAVFSDGRVVGAALDRNGLRPARYAITSDGLVVLASEAGVLDVEEERVLQRGRLGPGGLLAVDLEAGRLIDRAGLERQLAADPAWSGGGRAAALADLGTAQSGAAVEAPDARALRALGFTREELQLVLGPMHRDGLEAVGSMGDDAPLAVLSERPKLLYTYFKQRFAQVTNPPIDPLRERIVMSLRSLLGARGDVFARREQPPTQLVAAGPVLRERDLQALLRSGPVIGEVRSLSLLFDARGGAAAAEAALERLLAQAGQAAGAGAAVLVLSDRGIDAEHAALPALLAVSAVHQRLMRDGLRLKTSLVADTGEARDEHQLATLLGHGAEAVCPWAALGVVGDAERYVQTLEKGLLKILSKMGIATLRSYQGAQLFEAVGLERGLVETHFRGTRCAVSGATLQDVLEDVLRRHASAFAAPAGADLEEGGEYRYRRNGERHAFEPPLVKALHAAIKSGERLDYQRYAELEATRPPISLRDLLRVSGGAPVPLDNVEPKQAIFPRFATAAMSLGALSPEAHQALAIAMNRLGGSSNAGEGGEPAQNFWRVLPGGDSANHHTKQVASARFGVTAEYLVAAAELQIKMAQGSKPGEGGQLPGAKVAPHIARVRHSSEGVTLISPPPHHDIYSIEDLAQLIYDLKRVNPLARVSVKLVAGAGIGTIAAGVVKARADAVVIGGHDGGTGASPLSSIKNAGMPWELGLLDVQRTLRREGLRDRVQVRVEGGFRTGRDVILAAALGAEGYGFGTAALVAAGCVMARQCHLNTCPAGIATQKDELRRRFTGTPERVVRFFEEVAEEVREALAALGLRSLDELIGRHELVTELPAADASRRSRVSIASLLDPQGAPGARSHGAAPEAPRAPERRGAGLDEAVLQRLRFHGGQPVPLEVSLPITNADLAVGARVAGELARRLRGHSLPADTLKLEYRGAAGQSFGAFATTGMRLLLEGEANDGVGKGLCGAEIVLRPRRVDYRRGADEVIAGNAVLYGATSGRLFAAGRVGERFAVRNSGALAVVEGAGDHACEYMTAGAVVILGSTGRNLGAGMTGGLAYVLDTENALLKRLNTELVRLEPQVPFDEEPWLWEAIERHLAATGSPLAAALLRDWGATLKAFRRVVPRAGANLRPQPWLLQHEAAAAARA
jgi:glutamate synthase domain-containing protein 2/glutamate synthase domain-containing protein 1/glutamate synthase domain-containing protein 3